MELIGWSDYSQLQNGRDSYLSTQVQDDHISLCKNSSEVRFLDKWAYVFLWINLKFIEILK